MRKNSECGTEKFVKKNYCITEPGMYDYKKANQIISGGEREATNKLEALAGEGEIHAYIKYNKISLSYHQSIYLYGVDDINKERFPECCSKFMPIDPKIIKCILKQVRLIHIFGKRTGIVIPV